MKYLLEIEATREDGPRVSVWEIAEAIENELSTINPQHPDKDDESTYTITNIRPYFPPKETS